MEGQLSFRFRFQLIPFGHSSTELVHKEIFRSHVLKIKNKRISNIHEQIHIQWWMPSTCNYSTNFQIQISTTTTIQNGVTQKTYLKKRMQLSWRSSRVLLDPESKGTTNFCKNNHTFLKFKNTLQLPYFIFQLEVPFPVPKISVRAGLSNLLKCLALKYLLHLKVFV
jgi:hypothetical protein